ncbi:hypothetical protein F751_1737 [Auxenochlorella protothecoides]|uniref:Uncharacterized protein n=1 Tax=Auxenochlorella protothecoides TaxID=3075 RepID=A0A087SGK4_AUXPR|nr:hypothetical protein F751_1737 [Auxenochlorella protothecoides]KFM24858.1 hypothetical protein F751_1737 [Auxenochlorella protothecoides]
MIASRAGVSPDLSPFTAPTRASAAAFSLAWRARKTSVASLGSASCAASTALSAEWSSRSLSRRCHREMASARPDGAAASAMASSPAAGSKLRITCQGEGFRSAISKDPMYAYSEYFE